jgi:hypothetical protein
MMKRVVQELEHSNTYPEALIATMKEMGLFGLAVPEPWGEAHVSTAGYTLVTEELARGWMSLAGAMGGHTVVAKLILDHGTQEQKDTYLPRMATGELRAAMALTEPGGGSDLQAMRITASREGDEYTVNGSKTWITNARRAGLLALLCKTDPKASPVHKGISVLLVEKGPGFNVSRDLPKLGYKGVESCELSSGRSASHSSRPRRWPASWTSGVPEGAELPPLWHWVYLPERRPERDLGPDGHPTSGIPAPPGLGRRGMFAGGRVTTVRSLVLGRQATRTTGLRARRRGGEERAADLRHGSQHHRLPPDVPVLGADLQRAPDPLRP